MDAERILSVRRTVAPRARSGMTLAEVMIALVILTVTLVSLGNFSGKAESQSRVAAVTARALDLANDRIDTVRHTLTYNGVDSMAATETGIKADSATYTRVTAIKHMGGLSSSPYDFKIVTVTVTPATSLVAPIKKTISIRSF